MTILASTEAGFTQAWRSFRRAREQRLLDPDGHLSIVGLHWLDHEPRRFEDVPGQWSITPDGVVVELGHGERLRSGRRELGGRHLVGEPYADGIHLSHPGGTVEVRRRFGAVFLRPRRSDAPARMAYLGTPTFAPDPEWVVPGRLESYATPRRLTLETVVEGRHSALVAVGEVYFDAAGRRQRLIAFRGADAGEGEAGALWLLFTDESSGVSTYAVARQLVTGPPDDRGFVELDFNRAVNMPCAYSGYVTCPLPPVDNHIDVLVEAGECTPSVC